MLLERRLFTVEIFGAPLSLAAKSSKQVSIGSVWRFQLYFQRTAVIRQWVGIKISGRRRERRYATGCWKEMTLGWWKAAPSAGRKRWRSTRCMSRPPERVDGPTTSDLWCGRLLAGRFAANSLSCHAPVGVVTTYARHINGVHTGIKTTGSRLCFAPSGCE